MSGCPIRCALPSYPPSVLRPEHRTPTVLLPRRKLLHYAVIVYRASALRNVCIFCSSSRWTHAPTATAAWNVPMITPCPQRRLPTPTLRLAATVPKPGRQVASLFAALFAVEPLRGSWSLIGKLLAPRRDAHGTLRNRFLATSSTRRRALQHRSWPQNRFSAKNQSPPCSTEPFSPKSSCSAAPRSQTTQRGHPGTEVSHPLQLLSNDKRGSRQRSRTTTRHVVAQTRALRALENQPFLKTRGPPPPLPTSDPYPTEPISAYRPAPLGAASA